MNYIHICVFIYYALLSQGYLVIGLEERMKYLRRPHKRSQVPMSSEDNPPAKRPPKPLMPPATVYSYSVQLQCIATVVIFLDLVYQSACTSFLVQVNADIVQEATELTTKQCCLLATGTIMEVREVFYASRTKS